MPSAGSDPLQDDVDQLWQCSMSDLQTDTLAFDILSYSLSYVFPWQFVNPVGRKAPPVHYFLHTFHYSLNSFNLLLDLLTLLLHSNKKKINLGKVIE